MIQGPIRFVVDEGLFTDVELERTYLGAGTEVALGDLSSPEAVAHATAGAHGIVLGTSPLPQAIVDALGDRVAVIGRPGVGLDNIDFDAACKAGIGIIHCPDYCTEEVASHALAMVLALARRLPAAARLAAGPWDRWMEIAPIAPLSEQTVGIVGAGGRTGRLLAEYLVGIFGEVVAFDPHADPPPSTTRAATLEEVLERADVVSLHVPLTDETRSLIGAAELARMRPGSAIVNVSRGGLIDEQALADALHDGRLSGAAVDVLAIEPPPADTPLLGTPNTIVTPHVAWYSTRAEARVRTDTVGAMLDYLRGAPLRAGRLAHDGRPRRTSAAARS